MPPNNEGELNALAVVVGLALPKVKGLFEDEVKLVEPEPNAGGLVVVAPNAVGAVVFGAAKPLKVFTFEVLPKPVDETVPVPKDEVTVVVEPNMLEVVPVAPKIDGGAEVTLLEPNREAEVVAPKPVEPKLGGDAAPNAKACEALEVPNCGSVEVVKVFGAPNEVAPPVEPNGEAAGLALNSDAVEVVAIPKVGAVDGAPNAGAVVDVAPKVGAVDKAPNAGAVVDATPKVGAAVDCAPKSGVP